jgi:pimeloyl-ACP methyl ester carboxylesterase
MAELLRGPRALVAAVLIGCSVWGQIQAAEPVCGLDVDGDGQATALSDGLLVYRALSGLTGSALTAGAVGAGCTRCNAADITAFLDQSDCARMLDVDGNGQRAAATDGVLFVRHLFGFTGEALIEDAVAEGSRVDAESIETQLAYYASDRVATLAETLDPGEQATTTSGLATLLNTGPSAVAASVIEGTDADSNPVLEIQVGGEGVELILPDADEWARSTGLETSRASSEPPLELKAMKESVITQRWQQGRAWFSRINSVGAYNRLPATRMVLPYFATPQFIAQLKAREVWSACREDQSSCYSQKAAVLFVHGFRPNLWFSGDVGGGEGTWADFPRLLQESAGVVPFEFRWNSAARFQDVAMELGDAIELIYARTGKPVHIVAHSFGGLLTRALLQGYRLDGVHANIASRIASVTTLGTPHSGIADDDECLHGRALPGGQDSWTFEGCAQLSCQQAGEDDLNAISADYFGVSGEPGELVAALADTSTLPDVDILVLIGLTSWRDDDAVVDKGDGLITYEGQRFGPGDSVYDSNGGTCKSGDIGTRPLPLVPRVGSLEGDARVTERILGFSDFTIPLATNPEPNEGGYRHSGDPVGGGQRDGDGEEPPLEASVRCETSQGCDHDGFIETKNWILGGSTPLEPIEPLNDTGIDWCANAAQNFLACPVDGYPGQDAEYGRDATHNNDSDGHAGFSFTKLDANGNALAASATSWSCVRDNVTGLVWEVKTDDGGLRDKDWTYNWYNPDGSTNGGFAGYADNGNNCYDAARCDTYKYVADVNSQGLCGARDWRLASVDEFLSIVSNDRTGPAIDAGYFPNTVSSWFWSSSPYADNSDGAWAVDFDNGYVYSGSKGNARYVRLVRAGQ